MTPASEHMRRFLRFRRKDLLKRASFAGSLIFSCLASTLVTAPAVQAQFKSQQYDLHIQAGPANQTLTRLAELTSTQLLFPFDLLANFETNALDGRYGFRRALRAMLRGTQLRASYDNRGTVVIYIVNADGQNIAGTTERPPHTEAATLNKPSKPEKGPENRRIPIEEIFVTSRKRSESIRDVPFSIAAQTDATIFLSGAQNMSDLARGISGLTFTDLGAGQSQIAIRGVSSGQVVRDQPGIKEQVGVYLDETAISMALFTPDLDFYDMNRVEVLRGPQGTLFGSGSLAGTVRYITNPPDLAQVSSGVESNLAATKGGDYTSNVKGFVNLPFAGNEAAVRAVAYYNEIPGYIDAVYPVGPVRENVNQGSKYGGRLAFALAVSERLTIMPRAIYQKLTTQGFPRADLFNVLANPYTQSRPAITLAPDQQYIQLQEGFDEEFLLLDTQAKYEWDAATLTAVSSYINRDILVTRDSGQLTTSILAQPTGFNLSGDILGRDAPLFDQTNLSLFSQEVRIATDSDAPLQYVLGGFYTKSKRTFGQTLQVAGFDQETGLNTGTISGLDDILFYSRFAFDFQQLAFFSEATYQLTDRIKITAGLRWFDYKEERSLSLDGLFAANTIDETTPTSTKSHGVTPRFIIAYNATEGFQINAQIAKGFRLGGINDPLNEPLCSVEDFETFGDRPFFDNEELWNYEVGFKSTLAGGRLTFDTSFFYADIRNLQATVDAGSCSSRIIFNVPRARSIGLETEVFIRPHPDFDISFSATMQSAEIRSTLQPSAAGQGLGGIEEGNRLPTSPTFQAASQFSYHWNLNLDWSGFAALSLQYVGASYTQLGDQAPGFGQINLMIANLGSPSQSEFSFDPKLPAYQTGSIRMGARKGPIELSLYVNNLWNETIRTSLDRERGGIARVGHLISRPRTVGLTVRASF